MNQRILIRSRKRFRTLLYVWMFLWISCNNTERLMPISVGDFEAFVVATSYVTDAERYGWSIVQLDVYNYTVVEGASWKKPDGLHAPRKKSLPVTQVSYNDAIAFCQWAGVRLPTYEEYWDLASTDTRTVVTDNRLPISPVDSVHVIGNVWDLTEPKSGKAIRLAGGSLFCSPTTCHGTQKERVLFVDKETGNLHTGFSVVIKL